MSDISPEYQARPISPDDDLAILAFRELQQTDEEHARYLHELAHSYIRNRYPDMERLDFARLKWAVMAGLILGERMTVLSTKIIPLDEEIHHLEPPAEAA